MGFGPLLPALEGCPVLLGGRVCSATDYCSLGSRCQPLEVRGLTHVHLSANTSGQKLYNRTDFKIMNNKYYLSTPLDNIKIFLNWPLFSLHLAFNWLGTYPALKPLYKLDSCSPASRLISSPSNSPLAFFGSLSTAPKAELALQANAL